MPRVKREINEKDAAFQELIRKYLKIRGRNKKWLIKVTGIPEQTFYKAMRQPEYLKVCQARAICDTLRIPQEERGGVI
ncbi:MAG: hypothetical protein IKE35_03775 [Lachnospiraceae bacterium]|nr:hypothetical protein [Lachnospiraceae bacterium]